MPKAHSLVSNTSTNQAKDCRRHIPWCPTQVQTKLKIAEGTFPGRQTEAQTKLKIAEGTFPGRQTQVQTRLKIAEGTFPRRQTEAQVQTSLKKAKNQSEIIMDRYSRNILINDIGKAGQDKISQSRILICGCGGLGSGVITNLASLGAGTIGLVDCDKVEISNLNRQFIHTPANLSKEKAVSAKEWIKKFNPDVTVTTYNLRLDEHNCNDIVKDYDILIDCFDSYESKFLLNKAAILSNKSLVHAGITEYYGQVTTVIKGETPCLNCLIPEPDFSSYIPKGVISPAVTLISSLQSLEAVKLILNQKPELAGTLLTVNCKTYEIKKLKITKNSNCPICK